jgi:hypothetical protein
MAERGVWPLAAVAGLLSCDDEVDGGGELGGGEGTDSIGTLGAVPPEEAGAGAGATEGTTGAEPGEAVTGATTTGATAGDGAVTGGTTTGAALGAGATEAGLVTGADEAVAGIGGDVAGVGAAAVLEEEGVVDTGRGAEIGGERGRPGALVAAAFFEPESTAAGAADTAGAALGDVDDVTPVGDGLLFELRRLMLSLTREARSGSAVVAGTATGAGFASTRWLPDFAFAAGTAGGFSAARVAAAEEGAPATSAAADTAVVLERPKWCAPLRATPLPPAGFFATGVPGGGGVEV